MVISCHSHDSGHGIDRSELSSSTDRRACDAIFSHLPAMSRHALASAVPHCIADTAASRASIPKAQDFDAMNRYSLTDQSRNFSEQMRRSSLSRRSYTKSRLLLDFRRGAQRVSPVCCGLMGRVRESRPVSTRPRRPCPPFSAAKSNFKGTMVLNSHSHQAGGFWFFGEFELVAELRC